MAAALSQEEIEKIVQRLRASFDAGKTRPKEARLRNLNAVLQLMKNHKQDIYDALYKDLRKHPQECQTSEVDFVVNEANHLLVSMNRIVQPKNVNDGSLLLLGKKAYIHRDPFGLCLIIGTWNYPIQLTLMCLVGAIATGNVAIVKPSELAPATAELLEEILPKYLDQDCFRIINGGAEVAQNILKQRFDHILYTGGQNVGKIVLRAAAEHLTPVTLELGGKNPVFIDKSASVSIAARRIAWGKLSNCGQTCTAPDYVMCPRSLKDKFIEELYNEMKRFHGGNFKKSLDYGRIVNERHFDRLCKLISSQETKIIHGGESDREEKYIAPTIFEAEYDDPIMAEEIFGPLMPVLAVEDADQAIKYIRSGEKPLALYVFSNDNKVVDRFMTDTSSGSMCVNDVLIQSASLVLPFGGVGYSGMGSYHGDHSVDAFSHRKSCVIDPWPNVSELTSGARYPPYSNRKTVLLSVLTKTLTQFERQVIFLGKLAVITVLVAVAVKVTRVNTSPLANLSVRACDSSHPNIPEDNSVNFKSSNYYCGIQKPASTTGVSINEFIVSHLHFLINLRVDEGYPEFSNNYKLQLSVTRLSSIGIPLWKKAPKATMLFSGKPRDRLIDNIR